MSTDDFCYCDGDEYADHWSQHTVKARKAHKCNECKKTIKRGEQYERISYLFEGEWSRLKICEYCWHDYQILSKAGLCVGLGGGQLKEAWKAYHEKKE